MAIVIEREIPAPTSEVLAAIARGGEWRESAIPTELRKGAVIGVDAWVKGSKFRWLLVRTSYAGEVCYLALWGRVEESPDGGSRVIARCGYDRGLSWSLIAAVSIGVLITFSEGAAGLALPGIAALVAVIAFARNFRAVRGADSEANYLVERFEKILQPFTARPIVRAPAI